MVAGVVAVRFGDVSTPRTASTSKCQSVTQDDILFPSSLLFAILLCLLNSKEHSGLALILLLYAELAPAPGRRSHTMPSRHSQGVDGVFVVRGLGSCCAVCSLWLFFFFF